MNRNKKNPIKDAENIWKFQTSASNIFFIKGNYKRSMIGYQYALDRAEFLTNHKENASHFRVPFAQIFAISCNNIAFTYEKIGLKEKGATMLKRVLYFLLSLTKCTAITSSELKRELKHALLNYTEYAQRNALQDPDIEKLITDIREELQLNR